MTDVADLSRDVVIEDLLKLGLEWGDEEDAVKLVDLLLKAFTPAGAYIWLAFWCHDLDAIPLVMLEEGRGREVFAAARALVARS